MADAGLYVPGYKRTYREKERIQREGIARFVTGTNYNQQTRMEKYMRIAKYSNGDSLRDKVTGLEGIVMVVAYYATGCIHYGIQPRALKGDGCTHDWVWLDESQFDLINAAAVKFDVSPDGTSGPMPSGPQR
jgi:hypothetical protein